MIPVDPNTSFTCTAMLRVRREANNEIMTRYVNDCQAGQSNFSNFPDDGSCPTMFEFSGGNSSIAKDPTTGLCGVSGGAMD